jgi:ureidoglycolate hydrolase
MTAIKLQLSGIRIQAVAEPLTQEAFAPFGDVIANPRPEVHPSSFNSYARTLPHNATSANQGSAIRYGDVSHIKNLYHQAPSEKSEPKMSMFVCSARRLTPTSNPDLDSFNVSVLERHPFTTQTFTPLPSSSKQYLVVVAPSLSPSSQDESLPVPRGDSLPGRGLPNVKGLRAFVAEGNQAVTYGAGTWHAPMVVLGSEGTMLDFVVFQFASGEAIEDCQLVEFESESKETFQASVLVPRSKEKAKL